MTVHFKMFLKQTVKLGTAEMFNGMSFSFNRGDQKAQRPTSDE